MSEEKKPEAPKLLGTIYLYEKKGAELVTPGSDTPVELDIFQFLGIFNLNEADQTFDMLTGERITHEHAFFHETFYTLLFGTTQAGRVLGLSEKEMLEKHWAQFQKGLHKEQGP